MTLNIGDKVLVVADMPPVPKGTKGKVVGLTGVFPFDARIEVEPDFEWIEFVETPLYNKQTWDRLIPVFEVEVQVIEPAETAETEDEASERIADSLRKLFSTPTVFDDPEPVKPEPQDPIAALMQEASEDVDKIIVARDHVATLMMGYIEAAKSNHEEGNEGLAAVLAMVADDFHTLWHLIDDGIAERNGEEPHDHSDEDH